MENLFDCFADDQDFDETTIVKAPMNYPGNKIQSLKNLLPLIPYDKKYIEVFGGSASVLINRSPSKFECYNDRHSGFTDFYIALQSKETMQMLKEAIELYPHSREFFYWCKETLNKDVGVVRGAKWYYMVQTSFAGRGQTWGFVTKSGAPIAKKIATHIPNFDIIHNRFKNVQIENMDWRIMFDKYDDYDTVFYLDPPYLGTGTYDFMMTKKDHRDMCDRIFELKGFVALSGYANDIYDQYPWDGVHMFTIDNKMCVDLEHRGDFQEYLWIKEFEE